MQAIRVAIIGYGKAAKTFHLPFINALTSYQLTAISTSQREALQADYPDVEHYMDASELIEKSDADLIVITAPNKAHYPLAKLAIAHGKHVLLEKPFVLNMAEGESLIAQAKAAGVVLTVNHNRRLDGDFFTIKQLIAEKKLGELKLFESHYDRFRPTVRQRWRENAGEPGSGILYDLGAHLIDQALELFGLPDKLTAHALSQRHNSQVVDYYHLILHYPSHQAILHSSSFCAAPALRFHLEGELGSYQKYGMDGQEEQLVDGHVEFAAEGELGSEQGYLYTQDTKQLITNQKGRYYHFYQQLAAAIQQQQPLLVTAEQALETIRLIGLAMQSEKEQRTLSVPK
ncbi:oxidoreductase [Celerinatantimonas yamalensis]|uniref:Oxidoreductase n=1 Tax=Celerinatantimonas yamalensis TaxID=559956 RepID=A0ABW9GB42_9GAMM